VFWRLFIDFSLKNILMSYKVENYFKYFMIFILMFLF
jgi:hypothetical protein